VANKHIKRDNFYQDKIKPDEYTGEDPKGRFIWPVKGNLWMETSRVIIRHHVHGKDARAFKRAGNAPTRPAHFKDEILKGKRRKSDIISQNTFYKSIIKLLLQNQTRKKKGAC